MYFGVGLPNTSGRRLQWLQIMYACNNWYYMLKAWNFIKKGNGLEGGGGGEGVDPIGGISSRQGGLVPVDTIGK